jgi:hypothetical protein
VTRKLSEQEKAMRKEAREQGQEAAKREQDRRARLEERIVDAGHALRLRKNTEAWQELGKSQGHSPESDILQTWRLLSVRGGPTRFIVSCFENMWPVVYPTMGNLRTVRLARRAVRLLHEWCGAQGLPATFEAVTRHNARSFLGHVLATPRSVRTAENYRAVLAQLWDAAIESEVREAKDFKDRARFPNATPMINPWRDPETRPATIALRSKAKRRTRASSTANPNSLAMLREGPKALKRKADTFARRAAWFLKGLCDAGVDPNNNSALAIALNEAGFLTERRCLWDATRVRRLKERVKWKVVRLNTDP